MAENKTQKTTVSVNDFLNTLPDEKKRQDSLALVELMQQVSGQPAVMWGPAIIGFGDKHYKYESGREGDWFQVGFSPRKQNFALYITGATQNETLLGQLGKYKSGGSCLYINKLTDIKVDVLKELIAESLNH